MDTTRDTILSIALTQFAARGYRAVGVQELCESAGITKPTLYYHFGNKRGLLRAIGTRWYEPFLAGIREAGEYRHDVAGSLVSILTRFLDSARSCPDFTRFRLSVSFSPPESEEREAFSPFIDNLYSIMQSFFTAASLDHGNMRGREVPYAASFIGTADTYSGLLLAGTLDPDEQYIRRIVHHFMHGIFS